MMKIDSHGLEQDIAALLEDTGYEKPELIAALVKAAWIIGHDAGMRLLIDIAEGWNYR